MPDSARSLYPDAIPSKTPQQPGLTTGPTGVVKHSDRPDNTKFWGAVRKAKTAVMDRPGRVDTLKLRRDILERVMTYCSLTLDRVCYAAVATIAEKEQAGTTSTRGHLRALERDGFLEAVGSRKGGRKTPTTYRPGPWFLHAEAPDEPDVNPTDSERKPNGFRVVNPTDSVAKYSETKSTYIKAVAAASTCETQEVQPPPVQPPALLPPHTGGLDEKNNPQTDTDRHTCAKCGKSWPARFGTICYQCPQPTVSQIRERERERRNEEAGDQFERQLREMLEKESLEKEWANKPEPPPASTDSPPEPSPSPMPPPVTPEQAQKHIDDMRKFTSKHKRQTSAPRAEV